MAGRGRALLAALLVAALLAPMVRPAAAGDWHDVRATLLANKEFAPALLEGIRSARSSVICCYYLFKTGRGRTNWPRRVVEELVRARQRGVEVSVILEAQGGTKDRLDADNHATAAYLARGGVKVFFDSPAVTTHSKVTVIDDRYVFLGSHNLTQGALSRNNELSLLLDSPAMAAEIRSLLRRL